MNVNDIYTSKVKGLAAADLNNAEHTLTIASFEVVEFTEDDGYKHNKIVLTFQGVEKTFPVNKTNSEVISAALGDNVESWVGRQIILYPTVTDFKGTSTPCIRIRPVLQQAPQGQLGGTPQQPVGHQNAQQQYDTAGMDNRTVPADSYTGIG